MSSDGDESIANTTYGKDVSNSLIPVLDETLTDLKRLFTDAKQQTAYTNNIWQERRDEYKVESALAFDAQSWNRNSPEHMREIAQLYYDQANIARREAALSTERSLNLQNRLSTSEIANKRLVDILEGLEPKLFEMLKNAAEMEQVRIDATREFKESHDRIEYERRNLTKQLTELQKNANELASNCRTLQQKVTEKNAENYKIKIQADADAKELELMKSKLSDSVKVARDTQALLHQTQTQFNKLRSELDDEKRKAQQKIDLCLRDCEKITDEKNSILDRQKKAYENEIIKIQEDHDKKLQRHKSNAQEAITRSKKEAEDAIESQNKYYKLYTELQANLETCKKEIETKMFARLLNGYRNFANDFNEDRVRNVRSQNGYQSVPAPTATNKFSENCLNALESTTSSDDVFHRRDENTAPQQRNTRNPHAQQRPQPQQQALRGTQRVARSYSVTGKFPTTANKR